MDQVAVVQIGLFSELGPTNGSASLQAGHGWADGRTERQAHIGDENKQVSPEP